MKIAKALKTMSRIKGQIGEIEKQITEAMSTLVDNEFDADTHELLDTREQLVVDLYKLKTKVMTKNIEHGMFSAILLLGELKAKREFIKGLSLQHGKSSRRFEPGHDEYKCQMTRQEKNIILQNIDNEIENTIDELDEFNATHEV